MAKKKAERESGGSPCIEVAKGGVGESGASSLVIHEVKSKISKLMVLRNVETSLCPNTGAAAMLVVNGAVEASGMITRQGSSIQAEAQPGASVVGIVHTVPLFNEIVCVRLGELRFRLDECDLVTAEGAETERRACVLPCEGVATRDWYAWNNLMPPKPDHFHIVGEVEVPNPGVDAELVPRKAKGKKTAAFDLVLTQRAGFWPQVLVWKPVRYDKVLTGGPYSKAQVWCEETRIEEIPVEDVS